MPKVIRKRQSRGSSQATVPEESKTSSKPKRAALGDVSNRRSTRLTNKNEEGSISSATEKKATGTARAGSQKQAVSLKHAADTTATGNGEEDNETRERRRSLRSHSKEDTHASKKKSLKSTSSAGSSSRRSSGKASKRSSERASRDTSRGRDAKQPSKDVAEPNTKKSRPVAKKAKRNRQSIGARVRSGRLLRGSDEDSYIRRLQEDSAAANSRGRKKAGTLCSDFLSKTDYKLVRNPFDASKYTAGVASYDNDNCDNVLEVSNYVTDIFQRLYNAETNTRPSPYVDTQIDINARMRSILVDWLVEVHMKFRLVPETLYLCVNILDRYCSVAPVQRSRLQLVGVTALLIACKYEEIYPPEVRDCVYITDRAYTRQEVLDMEQDIVQRLEFKMTVPTAYPFLQRFLLITKAQELTRIASNYYMERTLQEHDLLEHRPSLLAAAAVTLALNNPEIRERDALPATSPGVPSALIEYTGFAREDIIECASLIAMKVGEEITTASRRQLVAVKRKYDQRKHHHVSTEVLEPDVEDIGN